jgi:hypothetical protein
VKSLFFNQRNRQPLFYSAKRPGYPGKVKEQCNMQQATINFTASEVRQPVSLRERVRSTGREINEWLDTRSAFYSRIAEFEVTRRVAIRVNLVTMAVLVVIVAVETAPVAALAAAVSAAWLMYRSLTKKGGEA